MSDIVKETANILGNWVGPLFRSANKEIERIVVKEIETMIPVSGAIFVRLAGLSGAIAVAMGAYGAHAFRQSEADEKLKLVFETGNRYHMLHSIALLAVPMTRHPYLVGSLMLTGMTVFSGTCYYHALTGSTAVRRLTPYGGMMLIAAWASIAL